MSNYGWDLDGGSGGKAEFTKFPVGTTRIRVVSGAPHIRWTHWMAKFKRSINCPGVKICPIDDITRKQKANGEKPTYNATRRYAMNIYNYETGRMEIMEQGKTFMEDLKLLMQDAKEEGKVLSDWVLKVRRTGTGKDDTKYRIDKQEDATEELPVEGVIELDEYFKPHTVEQITRILNGEDWDEVMKTDDEDNNSDELPEDEQIEVK
jgi:hypothetical protein